MISKFINSLVTLKNKMFRLNENTNIKFMMGRICIFLLLFLIIPLNINALSSFQRVRYYYDRNDKINYDLTALNYKNFVYHYGVRKISGSITNKEEYKVKVITTVNFYDKNKNLLLEYPFEIEIEAMETNKFELKIDDSVSNDILNKVEYYCLESYDIIKPAEIVDLYNNYKFVKYDVKVNVNKNKTLDITKNMTSYFHKGKYGINYDIPLENKILRDDSTYTEDIVKIKNIEVNNVFTSFRKDKFLRIEIGSRNEYVKGNIDYEIKYNYDLGNDKMKDSDELYFNIIDTRDTSILNPTFTIIMPEEFDENELSFRDHSIGDGKDDNIEYTINGNEISGKYNGILNKGQTITFRLNLPEGYFEKRFDISLLFLFLIPISGLIITIILWYLYGRDQKVIETVEFYPPAGMSSLDVGLWYFGDANDDCVISLLIYLAEKGYIKITYNVMRPQSNDIEKFKITKLRNYDGDNEIERIFLEGLFANHNEKFKTYSSPNTVYESDLRGSFYITINKILKIANSKKYRGQIFESNFRFKHAIVWVFAIASMFTTVLIPTLKYSDMSTGVYMISIVLFYIPLIAMLFREDFNFFERILTMLFIVVFTIFNYYASPLGEAMRRETIFEISTIIGFICIFGQLILCLFLSKRSSIGLEKLAKIKGFRNFLETAEKDRIALIVKQDPSYFYDILPYAYALEVSKVWMDDFKTIGFEKPNWFDDNRPFSPSNFNDSMDQTMRSANDAMTSEPISDSSPFDGHDSGSSFSSSGSSGGGSGGGGGGSW